jgi:hypothetical protein
MSTFHKLALLGAAGATIAVSILFTASLAGNASSEFNVVPVQFANPTQRCAEQRAAPRAEPDPGCSGRPAAPQP